jgi:hypothetical protein
MRAELCSLVDPGAVAFEDGWSPAPSSVDEGLHSRHFMHSIHNLSPSTRGACIHIYLLPA